MQLFLLSLGARIAVTRDGRGIGDRLLGDGISGVGMQMAMQVYGNGFELAPNFNRFAAGGLARSSGFRITGVQHGIPFK